MEGNENPVSEAIKTKLKLIDTRMNQDWQSDQLSLFDQISPEHQGAMKSHIKSLQTLTIALIRGKAETMKDTTFEILNSIGGNETLQAEVRDFILTTFFDDPNFYIRPLITFVESTEREFQRKHSELLKIGVAVINQVERRFRQKLQRIHEAAENEFRPDIVNTLREVRESIGADFTLFSARSRTKYFEKKGGIDIVADLFEGARAKANKHIEEDGHEKQQDKNHFIRRGQYWEIQYEKETANVRDLECIRYVVHLIEKQGKEVHVADLVQAVKGVTPGDFLDRQVLPYRKMTNLQLEEEGMAVSRLDGGRGEQDRADRRKETALLKEEAERLLTELNQAKESGTPAEIEEAQKEYDTFMKKVKQLKAKPNVEEEKARVNVKNRIDQAIKQLNRVGLKRLAAHLRKSLRKGTKCIYNPEPKDCIEWTIQF